MESVENKDQGVFDGIVVENRRTANDIYHLRLEFFQDGCDAMANGWPGQFVELDLANTAMPPLESIPEQFRDASQRKVLLRRPFSFADIERKHKTTMVDIVYCIVGVSSFRMTTLKPGDVVSAIGPLGQGYWLPDGKKTALLVVGGMGAPPLQFMAKYLNSQRPDMETVAFAGAKTRFDLPFQAKLDGISQELGYSLGEFAKYGIESQVATDDGSAGTKGFVTELVEKWLNENHRKSSEVVVYACGPEAMLARIAKLSGDRQIDCQVSMERRMACGIGLCQSCAVECRQENGQTVYKMCCKDGPVFAAKDVVFGSGE